MPAVDSQHVREEDGYTLVELLVVVIILATLAAIAAAFQLGARERASDATARSNIRTAVPAIEAYRTENGRYTGMTAADLRSQYSHGIQGISVVSATGASYCVSAVAGGRAWYKAGPGGTITTTACS